MAANMTQLERLQAMDDDDFAAVIDVDLTHPERNREVFVFEFKDWKDSDQKIFDGIEVAMFVDLRHFKENRYRAWVIGNHEMVVLMPTAPYSFIYDHGSYDAAARASHGQDYTTFEQSHVDLRNDIIRSPAIRLQKYVLLRFPTHIDLNNSTFSGDFAENDAAESVGEVRPWLVPFKSKVEIKPGLQVDQLEVAMSFYVARRVVHARFAQTRARQTDNHAEDILAAALQGMDIE